MYGKWRDDPKLKKIVAVKLKRIHLLDHLDLLSESCLTDFQKTLEGEVLKTIGKKCKQEVTHPCSNTDDDDVIIVEEKLCEKPKRTKLKRLKRTASPSVIFSDAFKKATSALHPKSSFPDKLSQERNQEALRKRIDYKLPKPSGKLKSWEEKQETIMEVTKRINKSLDPFIQEELEAMASVGSGYNVVKSKKKKKTPALEPVDEVGNGGSEAVSFLSKPVSEQQFSFNKAIAADIEPVKKEKTADLGNGNLWKMLVTPALSVEEKFRVLDARDKLYQIARDNEGNIDKKLMGTCDDMCPEKERLRRIYQSQIHIFETNSSQTKEEWMVKEYARSSADQDTPLPHDLRPLPILTQTMMHLCNVVADHSEFSDDSIEDWYMFLWDRTRAIRKDVTQQDICDPAGVILLEQCARFHIHCAERLADQDISVYDDKINTENLTKTLRTLKYMYNDLRSVGVTCPNEPQFLCYSLLLNLNNPAIMTEVRDLPEQILASNPIRFALDIITAYVKKNYVRFFRLVRNASYLDSCLLKRYFSEIRLYAIKTIVRSYTPSQSASTIYVGHLVEALMFEGFDDCLTHLKLCNLNISQKDGVPVVVLDKRTLQLPDGSFPVFASRLYIRPKKTCLLSQVIWGGPIPTDIAPFKPLHTSFNFNGLFKLETIPKELRALAGRRKLGGHQIEEVVVSSHEEESAGKTFGLKEEVVTKGESLFSSKESVPSGPQKVGETVFKLNKSVFGAVKDENIFGSKDVVNPFGASKGFNVFSKNEALPTFKSWDSKESIPNKTSSTNPFVSSKSIFSTSPTSPVLLFAGFGTLQPSQVPSTISTKKDFSFSTAFSSDKPQDTLSKTLFPSSSSQPQTSTALTLSVSASSFSAKTTSVPSFAGMKSGFLFGAKKPVPAPITMPVSSDEESDSESPVGLKPPTPEPDLSAWKVLAEKSQERLRKEDEEKALKEARLRERLASANAELEQKRKKEEEEMKRLRDEENRKAEEAKRKEEQRLKQQLLDEERRKAEERRREQERRREAEEKRRQKQELLAAEKKRLERQRKLDHFKAKYSVWKQKVFLQRWRANAWASKEGKKMSKYNKELRVNYPPVCGSDLLDGNPSGQVIPNILLVKKQSISGKKFLPKQRLRSSLPESLPTVPLVHIGHIVASSLQERVLSLYPDPTSPFRSCFPWKLVLCLPDNEETNVKLDIFLERHFVDRFDWKFGVESGPLTECVDRIGSLEFHICVRRVKGCGLFEGSLPNPEVMLGSNSVLFFLTDDVECLPVAKKRLTKLRNLPGSKLVPTIIFVFGSRLSECDIRSGLEESMDIHVIICNGSSEQSLVTTLSESFCRAASVAAPVSTTRSVTFDSFLRAQVLDSPWRRVDAALINFDILLKSPTHIIDYYNKCLEELSILFLSSKFYTLPHIAPEFQTVVSNLEPPFELKPLPNRNSSYKNNLIAALRTLTLLLWPTGDIKSTQTLNYVLHHYIRKMAGGDKLAQRHLKWRVYQIIQKALLWKGLDIYCDEDINLILLRFPWVQVCQEFARFRIEQSLKRKNPGLVVMFEKSDLADFCYKSPLVDDLVSDDNSDDFLLDVDLDETAPVPENDSILLAYAAAIDRETKEAEEIMKRKRIPSLSEELEEIMNSKKPFIAPKVKDASDLLKGYDDLGGTLTNLESDLQRRRHELEEIMAEICESGDFDRPE